MFRVSARIVTLAVMAFSLVVAGWGQTALGDPINVLTSTDPIVGIWNTTAGGDSTASTAGGGTTVAGQYPSAEGPGKAIDGLVSTKYLNFGNGLSSESSTTKGVGTGFYVTPSVGSTLVNAIRFATANDNATRDPLTITLEGSNATGGDLTLGTSWTLIYSGPTGLAPFTNNSTDRQQYGDAQSFANSTNYTSYRVLVTSQRGTANSMQYSEVELLGQVIPEPSTAVLAIVGLLGVALFAPRRRAGC